jgi:hypothetical protein
MVVQPLSSPAVQNQETSQAHDITSNKEQLCHLGLFVHTLFCQEKEMRNLELAQVSEAP